MTRIVVDTNILVSALLNPYGPPAQVFLLATSEDDVQLCVSGEIFAEYEEVLHRPVFSFSDAVIDAALRTIHETALWVRPTQAVHACADPDDDIFLECAQAADAHYLVTGNVKHFPATWVNTRVISARQYLQA